MYGTGITTGVSTPHAASSLRPLVLTHGSLEHTLLIPTSSHFHATQLRDQFTASLPAATEELAQDDEPSSVTELVARFLGFVAAQVDEGEDDDQGSYEDVLRLVLTEFETRFLRGNEVHAIATILPGIPSKRQVTIRSYYAARLAANKPIKTYSSALLRAAEAGDAKIFAAFGGQGNIEEYFDELREIWTVYKGLIEDFVASSASLLLRLSNDPRAGKVYNKGIDIMRWLQDPDVTPDITYLVSAPVSFPLIGLIQLCHYAVACKILGLEPGQVRNIIKGTTGHSQGIVTAAAISLASSWESFDKVAKDTIELLFWIGCRSQQTYPVTALAPSTFRDSIAQGEGSPTPMLSVRDMPKSAVQAYVDKTNQHLPADRHIHISLVNGARNVVVTGPPQSLYGLNLTLRKVKAPTGLDQSKLPFTERKVRFVNRFLPISAPFHSPYLEPAAALIEEDVKHIVFSRNDFAIPVYETHEGQDLRTAEGDDNVVPELIRMITHIQVQWEKATQFPGATHILDLGPGGISGIGALTHRNKDGTGVRVILAGSIEGSNTELGFKPELFDRDDTHAVKYNVDWVKEHGPKLIKTKTGETYVDTKFSRLLGLPPIVVAGMTPATVPWDFVAATMNAGYHIELGGGGYYDPSLMGEALRKLEAGTTPGAGITVNCIYVNPRAMAWQIPLIQKLRAEGVPINGLTIGAGVPSLEVANEYIETLGLKHIAFKPGSLEGIQQCINIAQANPDFPVILQWTGGRGGGHHSYEDFHQPILAMYGRIRRCPNLILVAGSGFGGSDDTYPYLTGKWAEKYAYPPMPFDGILFGSRMMVAKEAHTSKKAKQAICDAPGLEDKDWEKTYKGPAGGVLTVKSEMGEPIHKLATRGVVFWHEMDQTIFNLDKAKRIPELKKRREYIIKKLNADFQKTWFGCNSAGEAVDLEDMTYAEVINRMIELMFVKHESRWIDKSLRNLTGDWIRRVEERFTTSEGKPSLLQNYADLEDPFPTAARVIDAYPDAKTQLINAQDMQQFLMLCQRPFQKPVPFVPALDENFEFWFKKDSLWQSEDLEAVVGQDVERTCILQGPMAVKYSTVVDEPIKSILDGIHQGHIKYLLNDLYSSDESSIPTTEYFGGKPIVEVDEPDVDGLTIIRDTNKVTYRLSTSPSSLPDTDTWLSLLAGKQCSWRHAFFTSNVIVQGSKYQDNPIKRVFAPAPGLLIQITNPDDSENTVIRLQEASQGQWSKTVEVKKEGDIIKLELFEHRTADGKPCGMPLLFKYHPEAGYAPLREVMEGRNDRIKDFYYQLWFGADEKFDSTASVEDVFDGGEATVTGKAIAEFVDAVGNRGEAFVERSGSGKTTSAPMDFAIVVGWKAIIKAIFPKAIDGDLLKLVHLSNGFRMLPGAEPLQKGDTVTTTAQINAVLNQDSGKMVEVTGTISRDGKPVMEVTSQFLYRGFYTDFENTFQRKQETPMQVHLATAKDVAVLASKEWFRPDEDIDLLNKTLTFRLSTVVRYKNKETFSSVQTLGQVLYELPTKEIIQVATVEYEAGASQGNPVVDYLQRNGNSIEQPVLFENAIPLHSKTPLEIRAPASNEGYARVSGDYNPIHVSRTFSKYANLRGTITHGMYSSAAVRAFVETWAAENNIGRVRSYTVSFVGMVLPNDDISISLKHSGMVAGRKIINVEVVNKETEEKVLVGEAEVEQPVSAYVFTGQGSQEQGMGMDLYDSSPTAKAVWDRADKHFMDNYGFSIIDIVRHNPKELTVHFGGPIGKAIRQNYMAMTFETVNADGSTKSERMFKEIDENTTSYTYRSPTGLLSATQFTQPALTLMEKASFEDMRSRGLVQRDSMFAGHSLGEYSALAALAEVMPIESLVSVVFYRGLTMQVAVERDEQGRSNYSMCAVNPSRVSKNFSEQALQFVVDNISTETGWLLEIVNLNVYNQQYVCAGDLRALDTLTSVLNFLKHQKIDIQMLMQKMSLDDVKAKLLEIVRECQKQTAAKPRPLELQRGLATIPLRGIDVPFHSTFLRSGVKPFRNFLMKKINKSSIDPSKLIGKYIPNVTARPFAITKEYFEDVYRLTNSPRIGNVLANWEKYAGEDGTVPSSALQTEVSA
ncbi:hypothetical protein ABW19_dt0209468 [Dactylella cylindrospora]|nr:hypothetical protein ABW19_dt0209468 [Dactylella cylindrospora]